MREREREGGGAREGGGGEREMVMSSRYMFVCVSARMYTCNMQHLSINCYYFLIFV